MPIDVFYREYWRKRPLYIPGGAASLSAGGLDRVQFLEIQSALEQLDKPMVRSFRDGTVHAQNLDRVCPRLKEAAEQHSRLWRARSVWFDASLSPRWGGIGSHADTSDNFVLQQEGSRLWRLHSPACLDEKFIRARCVGVISEATVEMAEAELEYELGPGDLLYIPYLWLHEGITTADQSISMSLAFNLESPLLGLFKLLRRQLTAKNQWWHPLPLMPLGDAEARSKLGLDRELDGYFEHLLAAFSDPDFRENLKNTWRQFYE